MTQPVSRRNALGTFSTIGLGALLASCSSGGEGTASAPMTEATVETVEGETATVSPQVTGTLRPESFAAAGSCTLTRELTEGPYYFDVDAIRSDIREDRPGTALRLGILVQDVLRRRADRRGLRSAAVLGRRPRRRRHLRLHLRGQPGPDGDRGRRRIPGPDHLRCRPGLSAADRSSSRRGGDRDGTAVLSQPTLSQLMGDSQVPDLPSRV